MKYSTQVLSIRNSVPKGALWRALVCVLALFETPAQFLFNSGSNGSYGPMNIERQTTLALPQDGIFHCTTITVASNATLSFIPNALNTPVYLLATGDVTINGRIDVSGDAGTQTSGGMGGPGGFPGGNPGVAGLPAGDGYGPGAGKAGLVGSSFSHTNNPGHGAYGGSTSKVGRGNGTPYGSPLLIPLLGGSGGGGRPGKGGSGSGGAILIASETRIVLSGRIEAYPGPSLDGASVGVGSGGAVRLVSPSVSGSGVVNIEGFGYETSSGAGRSRVDCFDRRALDLTFIPISAVTIGANMVVFPPDPPRLDITRVAGNDIPAGANAPVFFMLPQGASTNQTVTVQASQFGAKVPIRVVLTPDHGSSASFDAEIDNTTANPASVTVPVIVPAVNEQVQVHVWTR